MTHRSGYVEADDIDPDVLEHQRAALRSLLRSERGQAFVRRLAAALDAMAVKELASGALVRDGQCCAMGALCRAEGIEPLDLVVAERLQSDDTIRVSTLREEIAELLQQGYDPDEDDDGFFADLEQQAGQVAAERLNIPGELVRELMWINDEARGGPHARWTRIRRWARAQSHSPDGSDDSV